MIARAVLLLGLVGGLLATAAERELTGKVVDANTGEPIAHARLTLRFYQSGPQAPEVNLLSDADGTFRIANMPEGGYQVSAEKTGYLTANQGMGPANPVDGKSTQSLVLKLIAQAAIEGTIVDDKDMPAENAFLQLVRQQVLNGKRQYQNTMGGNTDETGHFRLFGLPAGRYYLAISARVSGGSRAKSVAYPPLFYPNVTDIAAAQPVDLKAGDNQELRIRLPEPIPAHEIRGSVAGGGTYVNVNLMRQPASLSYVPPVWENNWDAKARTFRISRVVPGTYRLTANSNDGKTMLQASTMFTVGDTDISGIHLELAENGIDGTVRMEGNTGQTRPVGYVTFQADRSGNGAPVDAEGKFHVANLMPDTYRVIPQIGGPMCVRSVLQGGRDVRDGLIVTADGGTAPIEIVVTSHCGTIEGTITPSDSMPSNLMAMLLRKSGDELVMEKQQYIGGGRTRDTPRFSIQGVTPGDYLLYVWPQDSELEYANAEYMRQFESYGVPVTVPEDGKVSATVDKVLLNPSKN